MSSAGENRRHTGGSGDRPPFLSPGASGGAVAVWSSTGNLGCSARGVAEAAENSLGAAHQKKRESS